MPDATPERELSTSPSRVVLALLAVPLGAVALAVLAGRPSGAGTVALGLGTVAGVGWWIERTAGTRRERRAGYGALAASWLAYPLALLGGLALVGSALPVAAAVVGTVAARKLGGVAAPEGRGEAAVRAFVAAAGWLLLVFALTHAWPAPFVAPLDPGATCGAIEDGWSLGETGATSCSTTAAYDLLFCSAPAVAVLGAWSATRRTRQA